MKNPKAFDLYRLSNGKLFEFRYISAPAYGFVFGILDGRDKYLTPENYQGAALVELDSLSDVEREYLSPEFFINYHQSR